MSAEPIEGGPAPGLGRRTAAALRWLTYLLRVSWLCGYAVALLAVGAYCFIFNDQGQDLLRIVGEPGSSVIVSVMLFLSAAAWGLVTWYTSRLLLVRHFPRLNLPDAETAQLRKWSPRIMGGLAPAVLAVGFYRLGFPSLSVAYGALAVALFAFYCGRRSLFPNATGHTPAEAFQPCLSTATRLVVAAAIVLTFVLLLSFVVVPVAIARELGTAAIFITAATSIMLFASVMLTLVPLSYGLQPLLLPVLVWAVLCSFTNDNHEIRLARSPGSTPIARLPPGQYLAQWLPALQIAPSSGGASPANGGAEQDFPVVIVAAAGGGIRAAYWAAAVLGRAAELTGDATLWRQHLFAVSGVSGGSLGAAVHVVELTQRVPSAELVARAEKMLGEDYLSPVASFMLYSDLFQRFMPWPLVFDSFDRARAMELSFEQSAGKDLPSEAFSRPFLALWAPPEGGRLPALLLNTTRVETGQRVIVSNLALSRAQFLDAVDLLSGKGGADGQAIELRSYDDMPLSTAVHLSARFTYVSPAARVERSSGALWGRLVDGGYFENSGATTASDLIRTICPDWEAKRICEASGHPNLRLQPVVLLIKNDPHAASLCEPYVGPAQVGLAPFTETKPPIEALLNTRDARGRIAERALVRLVEGRNKPSGDCAHGCVIELSLAPPGESDVAQQQSPGRTPYHDPPLGWSLSRSSETAINQRLGDPDIQARLKCVAELAQGGSCPAFSSCPVR